MEHQTPEQPIHNSEEHHKTTYPADNSMAHNLDTGEDEPIPDPNQQPDETMADFGNGSGGGSAGDGAAA